MTAPYLVLDTNVIVSGLVFGGLPAEIIHLGLEDELIFVTSPQLQKELEEVLKRKFLHVYSVIRDAFEALSQIMLVVIPHEVTNVITQDPADNRVLECAVAGKAHFIISGDKHLLNLKVFRDIQIISPKEFLQKHPF